MREMWETVPNVLPLSFDIDICFKRTPYEHATLGRTLDRWQRNLHPM